MKSRHIKFTYRLAITLGALCVCAVVMYGCQGQSETPLSSSADADLLTMMKSHQSAAGRQIFRHYTFGDEQFWTDELRMHEVIQTAVDPQTALGVGLKVDANALPPGFLASADLTDPATTVELIKHDAVLGLEGTVTDNGELKSVGVTCALCHSTVDNSIAPGIGNRLDGWANRDLDPGLILSLSPAMQSPGTQAVLTSWGPGFYDARWNQDGINAPTLIPPIYGLKGVPLETYTGDGEISYWNSYVAITQMGGKGDFSDPRIGVFVDQTPDLVTPKLKILLKYQLLLEEPDTDPGMFDEEAAARGEEIFNGKAMCADCHIPPTYTDAGITVHEPSEVGQDPTEAQRSATGKYRTTPLRALVLHPPYFHDGSAATLEDVVEHYVPVLGLSLTAQERSDLVEYLKSI